MAYVSIVKSIILIGVVSVASACSRNEPAASSVPVIAFKSIKKITLEANATKAKRDSVVVTTSFRDGDGDLGEDPADSTRLKNIFSNQLWGNYQIRAFRLVNSVFTEITQPATPKLFFNLGTGTILPQVGTLDYRQLFAYAGTYTLQPVKFQLRMRDRSLNESNVVETDTISLPVSP